MDNTIREELRAIWHQHIPISAAMGVDVARCAEDELIVTADLAPNINVHGTAFAGSLYAISALAAWGMAWLQLRMRGLEGSILLAEGRISYTRAVAERIVCRCPFDAATQTRSLDRLRQSGKTVLELASTVEAAGSVATRFEGSYAVRLGAH